MALHDALLAWRRAIQEYRSLYGVHRAHPHSCDAPLRPVEWAEPARTQESTEITNLFLDAASGKMTDCIVTLVPGRLWGCWGCGRTHACREVVDEAQRLDQGWENPLDANLDDDLCIPVLNDEHRYVCLFSGALIDRLGPEYADASGYQDAVEKSADVRCPTRPLTHAWS